ncbi:MAG: ribonuclease PH, partial [Sciscionella sp.]
GATFPRSTLDAMLDVALAGCETLCEAQVAALATPYPGELPTTPSRK